MEIIEVTQLKNGRVRIRLEGGLSFLLYKREAARYAFEEGGYLTEEDWLEVRNEILVKRAKKRVMYLLQKQDRTEKQLRDKLRENGYSEDIIEEAIDYVMSYHYVDDERYAANYVHFNPHTTHNLICAESLSQQKLIHLSTSRIIRSTSIIVLLCKPSMD